MRELAGSYDIGRLRLVSGQGRHLDDLTVSLGSFEFGSEQYATVPAEVPVLLDISKMTGNGLALRLRFEAALGGPCMRCLQPALPVTAVDVREINQPGGGEELQSPYLNDADVLDLHAWAHDAFALELPRQVLCKPDCAGLCPECGADLNADPTHAHAREPDPRWAALRDLKLD